MSKCNEAEQFAYELLMPEKMIKQYIKKYRSVITVQGLAILFGVERWRMRRRLFQLKVKL